MAIPVYNAGTHKNQVMPMLDRVRSVFSKTFTKNAPSKNQAMRVMSSFMRDNASSLLGSWKPALRDTSDDVFSSWRLAAARSIDAIQNSGFMSGAIEQACADTIGTGLKLNAQPDSEALGWDDDYAAKWARIVERRWRAWANNPLECDARGKRTIGQMTDTVIRWHYGMGEATALLPSIKRPISATTSKVFLVSPHRLSLDTQENIGLHQGIFLDDQGMPQVYRFKRRINGFEQDIDIKAYDRFGRSQVIHVFDGLADQIRGISPLAPVLKVIRQSDQLADATLMAALMQTIIAATIKSPELSDSVFEALQTPGANSDEVPDEFMAFMQAKMGWWQNRSIDLGAGARIAHLFPGEELDIKGAQSPGDNYLPFFKNLMREIARCIGVTYEAATGDYVDATYSSTRMGISSVWGIALRRRSSIAVPFVQRIYETWLFEQIYRGWIDFPGGFNAYLSQKSSASQATWQGPAKPTADDLKTAKAQRERLENGVTTLAYECSEYGLDVEEVMEQRSRERKMAEKYGLPDPFMTKKVAQLPAPQAGVAA